MQSTPSFKFLAALTLLACSASAHALEWSDNSIGVKYGERFTDPGIDDPFQKTIYEFVHISGDKLGKNLVVGQVFQSDRSDPAAGGGSGAQEFFGFYRRTLSLSKLSGRSMAFGPIKDVSLAARFDRGTKNIAFAAAARKRMLGVAVDWAMPKGFVESTLYAYDEKNHNGIVGKSVDFDTTYRFDTNWAIPLNVGFPFEWRGGLNVVGAKGKDGFGNDTKVETRLYTEVLVDVGQSGVKVGVAYELWRNKYGADHKLISGANQDAPMLVMEYHF